MSLKYISRAILAICIFTGFISKSNAQDEGIMVDQIICKVDNYVILQSELDKAYLDFLSRGQYAPGDVKCEILESLIVEKVLVAKAEIDSVVVADLEVEANLESRVNYILSQVGGSEEAIQKTYGKTLEQIKDELRDDIKDQMVSQRMRQTVTEGVSVSPSEVSSATSCEL